ncbi:hypothetical protein FQA39_LY13812 [Lamprigera yunnana]|nr:hypothetical protein FQA39_LY13812 [Lamprigera yunnana]
MAVISAINAAILDELEDVRNLYILNIERSKLRDNSNSFSLSSSILKKLFRFEKRMMQDIIAMTDPFMRETKYLNAVPEHLKLLTEGYDDRVYFYVPINRTACSRSSIKINMKMDYSDGLSTNSDFSSDSQNSQLSTSDFIINGIHVTTASVSHLI